jgi:hypothetical protein
VYEVGVFFSFSLDPLIRIYFISPQLFLFYGIELIGIFNGRVGSKLIMICLLFVK